MDAGDGESCCKCKCRTPNLWFPYQGLWLRVSVVLACGASEGRSLAVVAPLAEWVQNEEAYTLLSSLTYIEQSFTEGLRIYKHNILWCSLMISLIILCLSCAVFSFLNSHFLCFFAFRNDLCEFLSFELCFQRRTPSLKSELLEGCCWRQAFGFLAALLLLLGLFASMCLSSWSVSSEKK